MDRTRLRNRFLRIRSNGDNEAYNKQGNYCLVTRIWKTKQNYYKNLDHRKLPIANHFGDISNLFSDNRITLVEKDLILEKNGDIAETFNGFLTSIALKLNIPRY